MLLKKTNKSTKQNRLKHFEWWETDQLAIYKYDQGVQQDSTTKQLQQRYLNLEVRRHHHANLTPRIRLFFFTLTRAYTA